MFESWSNEPLEVTYVNVSMEPLLYKGLRIDWVGRLSLMSASLYVALLAATVVLFSYMTFVVAKGDHCFETHIVRDQGVYISLAHDRDERGCIRNFDQPIGYELKK